MKLNDLRFNLRNGMMQPNNSGAWVDYEILRDNMVKEIQKCEDEPRKNNRGKGLYCKGCFKLIELFNITDDEVSFKR